jgi:hypothetical protein
MQRKTWCRDHAWGTVDKVCVTVLIRSHSAFTLDIHSWQFPQSYCWRCYDLRFLQWWLLQSLTSCMRWSPRTTAALLKIKLLYEYNHFRHPYAGVHVPLKCQYTCIIPHGITTTMTAMCELTLSVCAEYIYSTDSCTSCPDGVLILCNFHKVVKWPVTVDFKWPPDAKY